MLRALLRFALIVIVVVAAAAFFFGYRWGGGRSAETTSEPAVATRPVGTSGAQAERTREKARAAGAEIGDKVAVGAQRASEGIEEAGLTAKVKSKITLDDTLDGSRIHVSSDDRRVTLTGTVIDQRQHARALQLARETDGVASVVDQLSVGNHAELHLPVVREHADARRVKNRNIAAVVQPINHGRLNNFLLQLPAEHAVFHKGHHCRIRQQNDPYRLSNIHVK